MAEDRPDPDRLAGPRAGRGSAAGCAGKLKIFFGAAPGVGKTYTMLEAGRKVAKEGVDVLVGYVEPHVRPETQALLHGLDMLARRDDRIPRHASSSSSISRRPSRPIRS